MNDRSDDCARVVDDSLVGEEREVKKFEDGGAIDLHCFEES